MMFNECHVSDFIHTLVHPMPVATVTGAMVTASTMLRHQHSMYLTDAEVGILIQFLSDNTNETMESDNV